MSIKKIDHIGVAVENLEASLEKWARTFSLQISETEVLPSRAVRVAYLFPEEGPAIELVSPLGEESPVKKFLETRGEGIHHFCFLVDDIKKVMSELKAKGLSFLTEEPVEGSGASQIAFIHPRFFNGVLIEFKEKSKKPSINLNSFGQDEEEKGKR